MNLKGCKAMYKIIPHLNKVNISNRTPQTGAAIVVAVIVTAIVLSSGIVSAAGMTYYWTPSSGPIGSSGFTANWGSCNAQPTSYRVTALSSTGFTCNSDRLTMTSSGDQFLAIFPTAYSSDTQITGKAGATFYLSSQRSGYTATYRFDLGYARTSAFTSLGYVTQAVSSSSGRNYTIDLSSISGTAPSGSYPALKVSVTSSRGGRVYLGINGSATSSNSGRFYVNETAVTSTPTPTPSPTSTPTLTPTPISTPTPAPTPSQAGGQIKLGTNRFVILDDDYIGTPEAGFVNPANGGGMGGPSGSKGDAMKGKATTMGAYALYLDDNGMPVKGKNVTFTFYRPGSYGIHQTISTTTDSYGVANAFSNLDKTYYYGRWKVKAESGASNDSTAFIYNWLGCNYGGPGDCGRAHSDTWPTGAPINSPYTNGYDKVVGADSHHRGSEFPKVCTGCHRSYDGTNGTLTYPANTSGEIIKSGVHAGIRCENSSCHGTVDQHTTNIVIGSCYGGAGCHPFRTDISGKSTLNGVISAYSNSTGTYNKYHTPNFTVPCVVCHGPMHNTTKPAESQRLVKNNITENEHCWTCHTQRPAHYGTNCVSCHSQNAHNISSGGGPDCISCHNNTGSAIHRVNVPAINSGIHANLNSVASAGPGIPPENKKCWGCHQSDGSQPSGMGDRYNNPFLCLDCHGNISKPPQAAGALVAVEHFKNGTDVKAVNNAANDLSSCFTCHNKNTMKVNYAEVDGIWNNASLISHYGKKRVDMRNVPNETNCSYCHQNISEFNDVFLKLANTQITHDGGKNCYDCHREKSSIDGKIHDSSLIGGGGGSCTQCHSQAGGAPVVGSNDLGGHINLNTTDGGSDNLTDSDCMTCHYENPHGGPNQANTYYCTDCHTSIGTGPKKSTSIFTEKQHGQAACIDCHIADDKYHQGNPRGSVANNSYVNRYSTANIYTDCADCHSAANLDDPPFNAPGGGPHVGYLGATCSGGCHNPGPAKTYIQAVHNTSVVVNGDRPVISMPILSANTVSRGINVTVTATVSINNGVTATAWADGAQYRIMSGSSVIVPWTQMSANDGNFSSITEVASAVINTNTLTGAYTVEVRGMGGGPAQNPLMRYYPINGDVSATQIASLTVT